MTSVFVAYASGNDYHKSIIEKACHDASTAQRKVKPWSRLDTSGHAISRSVEAWIDEADAFVGDISIVNHNVTYEIGYAIGLGRPIRLIRSSHLDWTNVKSIGLLDSLGHDAYDLVLPLAGVLKKADITLNWPKIYKNKDQPVFLMQPPKPTDTSLRITSGVKKIARVRFRNFNPSEISRLNASEAYEQVMSSYGVIVFWDARDDAEADRNNQRASFIFGLARGHGIPALLIAHQQVSLPLDLEDQADRWDSPEGLDALVAAFRIRVADYQNELSEIREKKGNFLESLSCGDPVAENEAASLSDIFLETDAYKRALDGTANVLVGRKGSGKTAIFLRVRDVCRVDDNKQNIVIDLIPDGHQLVKMKEFILDQLGFGARKEVIAAFWEYLLWLEIAYKILEKDERRAYHDPRLTEGYRALERLYEARVDTGKGDFSERLKRLSSNIIDRFEAAHLDSDQRHPLNSSTVLEIIYLKDVRELRECILEYLRLKGFVLFLFDNLDRFWTPGGFNEDDALIVVGLTESMQEISRKFRRKHLDFRWAIFVRSDVYEFLVRGMADYGKLGVFSLEWSDRELLRALFVQRLSGNVSDLTDDWDEIWRRASVQIVSGKPVLDFLIDGSMMRPRYLIRLFEIARRRAITFGRNKIAEDDYVAALRELGWQVLEDLDREIVDLVPEGAEFLFELLQQRDDLTPDKFVYFCQKKMKSNEDIIRLLDVMIWNGSIGIRNNGESKYIFDCGYKRQYLSSVIKNNRNQPLSIHPTILAAVE
ncbi:P-loop ATPase, Sll1717 family [Radicibacter daui]|uniref:P-loop ATPase, Sll1717 family n=1 Tax=Radicibacter daui TaxID=3064829 RepID=UPI004046A7BF